LDEELMATITDYASLQSNIADYLNRGDLTSQIQMFIQLVEADLNTRLRAREMIVRAEAGSSAEYVQLPSDWLEAINLSIVGGTSPLRYITLDKGDQINRAESYTAPAFYSLMNGAIEIIPPPADNINIEMIYYGKIPALSDSTPTNWLLVKAPDVYLYGALTHAAPFLMDDQRLQTFGQVYLSRVESLREESEKSLHSGSPLIARTKRFY
jgi:hypothetical protein